MVLTRETKKHSYLIPEMAEAWPKIPRRYGAGECPRVSTVLDQTLPNHGLIKWAADVEARAQSDAWKDAILRAGPMLADKAKWVDERLGGIREHEKVKEKAGEIGSYAHALVEHHLYGMLGQLMSPPLPPEHLNNDQIQAARMAAASGKEWIHEVGLVPEAIECTVFDKELRVAGTLDVCGVVIGRPSIVDWKSSKNIYLTHLIQVAGAYHRMAAKTPDTDTWIVQLPKTMEAFEKMLAEYGKPVHAVLVREEQPLFGRLWVNCVNQFNLIKEGESTLRRLERHVRAPETYEVAAG